MYVTISTFKSTGFVTILQVLSKTVSNALHTFGGPESEETAEFVLMFDIINLKDGKKEKKIMHPYRSPKDIHIKVHKYEFINETTCVQCTVAEGNISQVT